MDEDDVEALTEYLRDAFQAWVGIKSVYGLMLGTNRSIVQPLVSVSQDLF